MSENSIIIREATLKDDMFCHYKYGKVVAKGITDDYVVKSRVPVHNDMKLAFRKFNNHLAVICEEVKASAIKDIDKLLERPEVMHPDDYEKSLKGLDAELYRFVVISVTSEGTGENEGVILSGKKKLSTGDWLMLTTPKITWESNYDFINELRIATDDLIHEVGEYMDGKRAPVVEQIDMFEPDEEDDITRSDITISVNGKEKKLSRKAKNILLGKNTVEQVEG